MELASGWYHVSKEVSGLKGGSNPDPRQRYRYFSKIGLVFLQFFFDFQCLMGVLSYEEGLICGLMSETCHIDPNF